MSAHNPISDGVVTSSITVNGSLVSDELRVLSIQVKQQVNHIARATLTVLDGDPALGTFPASSSGVFIPGAAITIAAGYDGNNDPIFSGIISGQSIRFDEVNNPVLEVHCMDAAVRMTLARRSATYTDQPDSDVWSSIIRSYTGLTPAVDSTDTRWPQLVQYEVSDWDFLRTRAEANGRVAVNTNGTVAVVAPGADTTSVLTVGYGDGLLGFSSALDALTQVPAVRALSWDPSTQALLSGQAAVSIAGPGDLSNSTLAAVGGVSEYGLQTGAERSEAALTGWAQAQLLRQELAKICGTASFAGSALLKPGNYLTLTGLGDRFSGDHFVSTVHHELAGGNWVTEAGIGLPTDWYIDAGVAMAPPAAGLLPVARGLLTGTVKQIDGDPAGSFRILVDMPLFGTGARLWARLAQFYASSDAGAFFFPEVGDEVLVGFLNEDPTAPVVLGSLYSSPKRLPFTGLSPDAPNTQKAIVSRSGLRLQFDDAQKVLTIQTPDGNSVELSDDAKTITVHDVSGNQVVCSESGVALTSPKSISISADGSVSISGTQGISLQAGAGDVQVQGLNIKNQADMQFSAQGGETAAVTGGMELTLKGAMVMIN